MLVSEARVYSVIQLQKAQLIVVERCGDKSTLCPQSGREEVQEMVQEN